MPLTELYASFWIFDCAACWRLRLTKRSSPTCKESPGPSIQRAEGPNRGFLVAVLSQNRRGLAA